VVITADLKPKAPAMVVGENALREVSAVGVIDVP